MSHVRGKDTKPELVVRSVLHRMGYRFSLRRPDLPGKPDIVMPKYKTVIFVHGCFWHRHPRCKRATTPRTNTDYWRGKFDRNVKRDRNARRDLKRQGWKVVTIWECEVEKHLNHVVDRLRKALGGSSVNYELPKPRDLLKAAERRSDYYTRR